MADADHGVIDAYLDDLRRSLRWHRHAADLVAEAHDHLRSTIEDLVARGADPEVATRTAIARFGDPAAVARAFAVTRHGRVALPTRSTTGAGVVALVSGALWLAVPVVWVLGGLVYDALGDDPGEGTGSLAQGAVVVVMGATLLGAVGTLFATSLTLSDRHGGLGVAGAAGIGACGIGTVASVLGWLLVGWGSLLVVGTMLVAIDVGRRGLAPTGAVLALGGGPALGALAWVVLRVAEVGGPDRHGDHPVADGVGRAVGSVVLSVALVRLGRWLAAEEPVELDGAHQLAAAPPR